MYSALRSLTLAAATTLATTAPADAGSAVVRFEVVRTGDSVC